MEAQLIVYMIFGGILGALVGSFLNVVIYRLPEGISIVSPPSACPTCKHGLAWYDNVPVFGWLWLSGKCRYCRTKISVQYPIIEGSCALLFFGMFWLNYVGGDSGHLAGVQGVLGEQLSRVYVLGQTWPVLIVQWTMIACLLASVMIDAKLFIIPLELPWLATLVCVVGLPVGVWLLPDGMGMINPDGQFQMIPAVGGGWYGAAIGGIVGLVLANVLLKFKVIPHGFCEEEEAALQAECDKQKKPRCDERHVHVEDSTLKITWRELFIGGLFAIIPLAGGVIGYVSCHYGHEHELTQELIEARMLYAGICGAFGLAVAMLMVKTCSGDDCGCEEKKKPAEDEDELWIECPRPRLMVLKEMLFLLPVVAGGVIGYIAAAGTGDLVGLESGWHVLGGVLLGYLVGCGLIWGIRILGTMMFGKEAMGLGDVHLLGAIGALVGWDGAILVFFIAPFFGLIGAMVLALYGKLKQGESRMIPYGPYLAGGAIIVMFWRVPIFDLVNVYLLHGQ